MYLDTYKNYIFRFIKTKQEYIYNLLGLAIIEQDCYMSMLAFVSCLCVYVRGTNWT